MEFKKKGNIFRYSKNVSSVLHIYSLWLVRLGPHTTPRVVPWLHLIRTLALFSLPLVSMPTMTASLDVIYKSHLINWKEEGAKICVIKYSKYEIFINSLYGKVRNKVLWKPLILFISQSSWARVLNNIFSGERGLIPRKIPRKKQWVIFGKLNEIKLNKGPRICQEFNRII